jgi:predicted CxxxxCH...CXXCH cytochrome family protein
MRIDARSLLAALGSVALAAAVTPACQESREPERRGSACTSCHGDASRSGSELARAAPPRDTAGGTAVSRPGVGAHAAHLQASATHGPVACAECHRVPSHTGDPGHADDALPAELTFGSVATKGGRSPAYEASTGRCTDSYCHRESGATWTAPRDSQAACGSCHALPPPAPHPKSDRCEGCHGDVVSATGFVAPELHVDGVVQLGDAKCDACHGEAGEPAPPRDLTGNSAVSALGVGAHRAHLAGGVASRAVACAECHAVPAKLDSPGHLDDDLPAEVALLGVATASGRKPLWVRQSRTCTDAWCHSPSKPGASPEWTSTAGALGCEGCHGAPPPPPHPQMKTCARCHGAVVGDDHRSIVDRARHVDGVVDVLMPEKCNACHGGENDAPPVDLSGATSTTSPGVGAHQAHVVGSGRARVVPCAECHLVPTKRDDPGHLDGTAGAELMFSGVATTGGAKPSYGSGRCLGSYCHGGAFPGGAPSGAKHLLPKWNVVDGSQIACDGCHGLPPPAPHPSSTACWFCHKNVDSRLSFLFPNTHVDGVVTTGVP